MQNRETEDLLLHALIMALFRQIWNPSGIRRLLYSFSKLFIIHFALSQKTSDLFVTSTLIIAMAN